MSQCTRLDSKIRSTIKSSGKIVKGADVTITAPPMVAILKSAPPHFYRHNNLDPEWAGKIKVIGSKLILHSDLASASRDIWVLGTSVFQITMPHVNFDNPNGVIGYFTSGREIRASDLRRLGLNKEQFSSVTRAGYDNIVVSSFT